MFTTPIVLTVSQLTQAVKLQLETQFPKVVVQGEISNFKRQTSGHLYFTLKDAKAQIQCAMFQSDARLLKQDPKNGDQVELSGELNVYPPRGNYQIIVRNLRHAGVGQLLQILQERKEQFLQKGWFDASSKKNLPKFPKIIGVITSPTGAVISDILKVLDRRAHGYHVILNPVRVQGEGAAEEISRAIDEMNQYKLADVVIVARGGGSIEDLWAFNEEKVVKSIVVSQIPIVSAVGHETDTTLSDLAADVRASTPTAAAEVVLAEKQVHYTFLDHCKKQIDQNIKRAFESRQAKLRLMLQHPHLKSPQNILRFFSQQVDDMQRQIDTKWQRYLDSQGGRLQRIQLQAQAKNPQVHLQKKSFYLNQIKDQMDHSVLKTLQKKRSLFENLVTHLQAINPKKLLEKGYSIVFDEKKNCAILSAQDISLKQTVKLILKDGYSNAIVEEVVVKNGK